MHIGALAIGAFVGWLLWTNGQPIWGVVAGLFIASGIWLVLPWRLLNPAYTRDALTFRKAAKAVGFWQVHDADFLRFVLEDWRTTKRRTSVSAPKFIAWTEAQMTRRQEQMEAAEEANRKQREDEEREAVDTERTNLEAIERLVAEARTRAMRETDERR